VVINKWAKYVCCERAIWTNRKQGRRRNVKRFKKRSMKHEKPEARKIATDIGKERKRQDAELIKWGVLAEFPAIPYIDIAAATACWG